MLLRLASLGITNAFALLRLLPGSDRDRDAEILALRHQLGVLQRQLGRHRVRFDPADRAWLAALLHQLPRPSLHHLPAPDRAATTWAQLLRSQAEALLAADFIETVTLTRTAAVPNANARMPRLRRPIRRAGQDRSGT